MARIVWKLFFHSLHFQWWFTYLGKVPILAQKCHFVQKPTILKSWKFYKIKFSPTTKIQNSANTKPLNLELSHISLSLYFYHDWRNALKLQKMFKNSSLKETGPSCGQKFVRSDNPGQNIWYKVEKSSKVGQDFKSLLSNFAWFLTAIVKV